MKNTLKKIAIRGFILFTALLIIVLITSPFKMQEGFDYPLIKETIIVDAPVPKVFNYLGDSDNARDWSVFVDHITTLNPNEVTDGQVGSKRRCFVNSNKKGTQWDELITEVVPNKKRQLTIYNLEDFPIMAQNLATEQIYIPLEKNKCELTFTVFYKDIEPTWGEYFKTKLAAFRIKSIFKKNMDNIKNIIETNR